MNFLDFLAEASKNKTIVFAFGRFNPPTIGHKLLVDKVIELAKSNKADHVIFASRSQDSKKNPLSVEVKVKYLKKMFPYAKFSAANEDARTFIEVAKALSTQGYKNLVMVAGSDRIVEFQRLLDKYNGKDFSFDSVKVESAGERDPDAEGASGMSGTKMREAAIKNNFRAFRKGIPSSLSDGETRKLMLAIRMAMNIKEFVEIDINDRFDILMNEGVHDKGIFKAVFLAGGPGSGKDYVLNNTLAGHGLVEINSDNALEYLMDKNNLDMKMPENEKEVRDVVRGKAKNMTELRQRLALLGRNGLIINGTGDDYEKTEKIKKRLEELGYDTSMVAVLTRDEISQQRNIERGQRGGRTVPEDIRKAKWDGVQKNRPKYAELFKDKYIEFDNSEDLRTAPEDVKAAKNEEMLNIFKTIRDFTTKPAEHPDAKGWIAQELNKKDNLKVDGKAQAIQQTPMQGDSAHDKAIKLGLQYYGFGRYGKNGTVTHHSVHGDLVEIGKYKEPEQKNVPISASSSGSSDSSPYDNISKKSGYTEKQKEKFKTLKASSKLPKDTKKESYDKEFETFLSEAVTFTITADTPEEIKKTIKLLKSDDEEIEEEQNYTLSDNGAFNALTLGMGMIGESVEHKKYLKDSSGKIRTFALRKSAAKEAHTKNGEVEKVGNHYQIKLKETKDVSIYQEFIQEKSTRTTKSGTSSSSTNTEESKKTEKTKITEIDFGTETGIPMSGYNKEKLDKDGKAVAESRGHKILFTAMRNQQLRKDIAQDAAKRAEEERKKKEQEQKKPVSELTGDETGQSIGDQKSDELKKQGISLSNFKARNYI